MKNFLHSTAFKVLACVFAFLLGMLIYAAATDFTSVTGVIFSPIQKVVSSASNGIHNTFSSSNSKSALEKENEELKKEINSLRKKQVELDELRRQNSLYKDFLGLKEQNPDYVFVDARVIAVDPADPYHNMTVSRGKVSNVKEGDVAMTPAGVVGVVYEVGANYAKVRSILDPALQIGCYDSRTREDGISTNSLENALSGKMELSQMTRDSSAAKGDTIVTYGGLYPSGLLVGEIESMEAATDGLSKNAIVKPFADMESVSEVFIIINFKEGDQ